MNLDDFLELENYGIRTLEKKQSNCKVIIPHSYITKCHEKSVERYEIHKNHKSQTIFSPISEFIGLVGESGFAILKNLKVDWSIRIGGDKYDFKIGDVLIDIKTTQSCQGMYIKDKVFHKDSNFIYILAKYEPTPENISVSFVGWIRGSNINKKIKKNNTIYVPDHLLEEMNKLDNVIKEINNGQET